MQFQVSKNSVKISSDMIDQTRLSINLELMRDELDERVSGKLLTFETQIKAKVKKRLKQKDIVEPLKEKMDLTLAQQKFAEFFHKFEAMQNTFEYGIPPAMDQKVERMAEQKIEKAEVEQMLKVKVNFGDL